MSEESTTNPTTAVVFQAPEIAAPRRASAPAGPPPSPSGEKKAPAKKSQDSKDDDSGEGGDSAQKKGDAGESGSKPKAKRKSSSSRSKKTPKKDDGAQAPSEEKKDEASAPSDGKDRGGDAAPEKTSDESSSAEGQDGSEGDDSGEDGEGKPRRRRRRGGRGRGKKKTGGEGESTDEQQPAEQQDQGSQQSEGSTRRRKRASRGDSGGDELAGSTRLQAKRQRRRENRDQRRRPVITEAEFLARRESVKRSMVVREKDKRVQIAVLEDDVLVEHYVSHQAQHSMAGNVYLGRVQNVLPGMEAAFVDIGRGRNAVLYAGEVNWDAAGLEGKPRRIELALKPGDTVMVQVTKDPIGHKGARVTSQISLAGRYLVFVPGGGVTGISRRLPDTERARLKKLLREVIPSDAGVIVRTAAEGASEDELRADVERLTRQWNVIQTEAATGKAPALLRGEPDMAIRVVRDIFNEDFDSLTIQGDDVWNSLSAYVSQVAPDLAGRVSKYTGPGDVFTESRIDEQLSKGMDRKVWLPSGGSLVIDRTEAMTVIDVNTGKFVGKGGTLEETMTLNNLEAAEEIVRQLRLRDIGGIIVVDFVDMLLEANRDRVLRRLIECLGRDRTKHQVAEVTSLGLVQMTRKRVGQGLVEAFSETCDCCKGRGFLVHGEPVPEASSKQPEQRRSRGGQAKKKQPQPEPAPETHALDDREENRAAVKATLASIAAAAEKAHHEGDEHVDEAAPSTADITAALAEDDVVKAIEEAVGGADAPSEPVDAAPAEVTAPEGADEAASGPAAGEDGEQREE